MRSITTKKGDQGITQLYSGERVSKSSRRMDTCGDIDELVSVLGLARVFVRKRMVRDAIVFVQRNLFIIASEIATDKKKFSRLKRTLNSKDLVTLDEKRDTLEKKIKIPRGFIIPGSGLASSHLDYARAVCRRVERRIVVLFESGDISNAVVLAWINRLSDYLYLLARCEEKKPLLLKD